MPSKPIDELEELVGTTKPIAEDLLVERGKVEEFARAIGAEDALYRDEGVATERGFETVPAPITFIRTVEFPRYRPTEVDSTTPFDLALDPRYLVHGEQEFEFERPLYVGDRLTGVVTLTDVSQSEGRRGGTMTLVTYEYNYYDEAGDLVLTERSTGIETEGAIDRGAE